MERPPPPASLAFIGLIPLPRCFKHHISIPPPPTYLPSAVGLNVAIRVLFFLKGLLAFFSPSDWRGFNEILPRRCSKSWGKAGVKEGLIAEALLIDLAPGTLTHSLFIIPWRLRGAQVPLGASWEFGEQTNASLLGSPGPVLLSRLAWSPCLFCVRCESGHTGACNRAMEDDSAGLG